MLQNIKRYLLIIIDFDNKTLIIQIVLIFGLIVLFGLNLGFNEILLSWFRTFLFDIFEPRDLKNFALKYFVVLSLSSLILVKTIFALVVILKHYHEVSTNSKFQG